MFADPALVTRRLGQGAFRLLVTDGYERQCAVTREHTLPVLEAAHIKPVALGGLHQQDYKFRVSRRLGDDWSNGKIYYALKDREIKLPKGRFVPPSREMLEWHGEVVFLK